MPNSENARQHRSAPRATQSPRSRVKAKCVQLSRFQARRLAIRCARTVTDHFKRQSSPAAGPIDVVDLFSGCGGLSTGFEYVGRQVASYRLAAAVDFDKDANASYAANLPIMPSTIDLSRHDGYSRVLAAIRAANSPRRFRKLVLVGGPPCQGFSAHRKKNGHGRDERNNLVRTFADIAVEVGPDFIVFENVPEVLAKKHWGEFEYLKDRLEEAGYFVRAQIHSLAGFGVPQERFRALVLAARRPFEMPRAFLEPSDFRTVRDAIGDLPSVAAGKVHHRDPMHVSAGHRPQTLETIRKVPHDGGRRPRGVGPRCLDEVDGFRDVYGRMYWDRPANTITGYARNPASGRYVHPRQDRGLTVREAALLQGFPKEFRFEGSFDRRFAQIGNGVPPIFAAFIAAHVLGELCDPAAPSDRGRSDITEPTSNSYSSGISGRKKGLRKA